MTRPFVASPPAYAVLKTAGTGTTPWSNDPTESRPRLAAGQRSQELRAGSRRRWREPQGPTRRVHRPARSQRRRQDHAVPAALRPVHGRFRPHRGHGPRHGARSGPGAGAARYRLSAAHARSRALGHRQPSVPCRPARNPARRGAGPYREGACAARTCRARPRQDRAALRRQPPPRRARARAPARAAVCC